MSIKTLLAAPNPPPVVVVRLPAEAQKLNAFWMPHQAAVVWGKPYQTVRRWLLANKPYIRVLELRRSDGRVSYKLAMPAGTVQPPLPKTRVGNPEWRDGERQRALVNRRWEHETAGPAGDQPQKVVPKPEPMRIGPDDLSRPMYPDGSRSD